jgi:hypothetical protein
MIFDLGIILDFMVLQLPTKPSPISKSLVPTHFPAMHLHRNAKTTYVQYPEEVVSHCPRAAGRGLGGGHGAHEGKLALPDTCIHTCNHAYMHTCTHAHIIYMHHMTLAAGHRQALEEGPEGVLHPPAP